MLIAISESTDVYGNLAIEECLLDAPPQVPVLFLYANAPCVVIGKNQNPWRECRLSLMAQEGVAFARRISGGGAVYHDEGNLNISVITSRTRYCEEKQYALVSRALEPFGIRAERLGKSSLAVNGRKFSGQAFCYRGQAVLHHGTLLARADLDRLRRYLGPELPGIETRAVASIPASVMNLSDASPGLSISSLHAALADSFRAMYSDDANGREPLVCSAEDLVAETIWRPLAQRNAAEQWLFDRTPRFEFSAGGRRIRVEKARLPEEGGRRFADWLAEQAEAALCQR